MQLQLLRYLTYFLAACVILSDGLYLFYLNTGGHMVRHWSGMSSSLLGLFLISLAMLMRVKESRWAPATILVVGFLLVIGALNMAVGLLFFL